MFKNVANLVKFQGQRREAKRRAEKEAEAARAGARAVADSDRAQAAAEPDGTPAKSGNFIVRRGRKHFATMARRLQRVKLFASSRKRARDDELDGLPPRPPPPDLAKPKFVIDCTERALAGARSASASSIAALNERVGANEEIRAHDKGRDERYQQDQQHEDSDDEDDGDDLYFSAVESLDQGAKEAYEDDEGLADVLQRARDEKFVLPEELSDIPTFRRTRVCERALIDETRRLLRERHAKRPDLMFDEDYELMLADDWTVSRFLLRRRLEPARTAQLMESCGQFRRQFLMGRVACWEFPAEFHLAGGLFQYAPDRVGNTTMYMRIKMYKRVACVTELFKRLVLATIEQCDVSARGRGTAIVFDLSECSLQNVDLAFLYWLLNSLRAFCPKGLSYILVLNLPWFLSATAKLALTWMSATNRRSLRFVRGREIEHFIAPENLPDYLGGTCARDYRRVPAGSFPAKSLRVGPNLAPLTREQAHQIVELLGRWLPADFERALVVHQRDGASAAAAAAAALTEPEAPVQRTAGAQ